MLLHFIPILLLGPLASCSGLSPRKGYVLPPKVPNVRAKNQAAHSPSHPYQLQQLQQRETGESFDIGFQLQDAPLFSGSWTGATGSIPLGPTPFQVSGEDSFSFTLDCLDCRTYGNIIADFNDNNGLGVTLTFENAGAYLDLGISASNTATVTLTLGRFLNVGRNVTVRGSILFIVSQGPNAVDSQTGGFNAKLGLGLDLVIQLTTAVEVSGGFQLCIPNGAQLGFDINLRPDPTAGLIASADIKTFPSVNFAPLPISLNSTAANVTVALVLKVEAGISADLGLVAGDAGAGASLTLVEVKFGEVSSSASNSTQQQCLGPALFLDVDSNAGAFAQAGLSVPEDEFFSFTQGPSVSTIFASAGTTTCLAGSGTDKQPSSIVRTTAAAAAAAAVTAPTGCAAGGALVTEIIATTNTYSLTSCLVPVINCPASLTQLVVVTDVGSITTTRCPTTASAVPGTVVSDDGYYNYTLIAGGCHHGDESSSLQSSESTGTSLDYIISSTTETMTVTTSVACPSSAFAVPPLSAPITSSLPPQFASGTGPVNATVTGVFQSDSMIVTPSASATDTNGRGTNNTMIPTSVAVVTVNGSVRRKLGRSMVALVGGFIGALLAL
ncbi:hypothetical protein QBC46DRAFT_411018 [Diplogelasinospora grovesii]|uniref:Uncharacterized protein n=1 Tax=Diplogelasinospora grovesii TaxID=303347 RepID=A0AAN6S2M8_9PEZI|nr:hypothetical protein QBC46DRAFT_411018 [Diplogelasinospora grovesii]